VVLQKEGIKTMVWGILLGYVCHLQVQGHQDPLLFSGVFIAEEVDEAGDSSQDTKQWFMCRHS
jgi:hypothetical protein